MTEMSEVTSDQFKTVMRRFAASVNVITSSDGEVTSGMTATAVCSVSADPPSALIIVNRSNRSHPVISRSKAFAVNVLCAGQKDLANHFASRPSEPFAGIPHRSGKTGCPIIEGADAFIECLVFQEMDVGTHTIFLGRIVSTGTANSEPLLYHEGRYHGLSANA
jgi:flavin reductase